MKINHKNQIFAKKSAKKQNNRHKNKNKDIRTEEQKTDAWLFFRQNDIKT